MAGLARDLFCQAGTPVVLQGRAGLDGTIVTVIMSIPPEALRERVAKHDLSGAFLLREDWWGMFIEPCQQPELSIFNPRGDLVFCRAWLCVRAPSYRSCGVPRGLCSGSRATQKGPSAHQTTEQGATSVDCTTQTWKRCVPVSSPGRGRSMRRSPLNILRNSPIVRAFICSKTLCHECGC